jgi:hypothetical protein
MTQEPESEAARLQREHAAAVSKLTSLRERASKLGGTIEEKLKQEIFAAEVELTRLSALLGSIGL